MRSLTLTVMLALACGDEPDDAAPQTATAAADDGSGSSTAPATDDDGSNAAESEETAQAGESTSAGTTTGDELPSTESSTGSSSGADADTSAGNGESGGGGFDCSAANPCHEGETCVFPMGDCGAMGSQGNCIPNKMPCDATFLPVCGCDDVTYANECMAIAAGVDVAAEGPC